MVPFNEFVTMHCSVAGGIRRNKGPYSALRLDFERLRVVLYGCSDYYSSCNRELIQIALATENNDGQRDMNAINWKLKNFAESWDWK